MLNQTEMSSGQKVDAVAFLFFQYLVGWLVLSRCVCVCVLVLAPKNALLLAAPFCDVSCILYSIVICSPLYERARVCVCLCASKEENDSAPTTPNQFSSWMRRHFCVLFSVFRVAQVQPMSCRGRARFCTPSIRKWIRDCVRAVI